MLNFEGLENVTIWIKSSFSGIYKLHEFRKDQFICYKVHAYFLTKYRTQR